MPIAVPRTHAMAKPMKRRMIVVRKCFQNSPDATMSAISWSTRSGDGRTYGGKTNVDRACQPRRRTAYTTTRLRRWDERGVARSDLVVPRPMGGLAASALNLLLPATQATGLGTRSPVRRAAWCLVTGLAAGLLRRNDLEPRHLRGGVHEARLLHQGVDVRFVLDPLLIEVHGRREEVVVLHVLDRELDVGGILDREVLRIGRDDLG